MAAALKPATPWAAAAAVLVDPFKITLGTMWTAVEPWIKPDLHPRHAPLAHATIPSQPGSVTTAHRP